MSGGIEFKATLDISGKSEDFVTEYCIQHLKQRGYNFTEPNEEWETPTEFMARVKLKRWSSFHRDVRIWLGRGGTLLLRRSSPGGRRIMELLSNPGFDTFCRRNFERPKGTSSLVAPNGTRPSRAKPEHLLKRKRKKS